MDYQHDGMGFVSGIGSGSEPRTGRLSESLKDGRATHPSATLRNFAKQPIAHQRIEGTLVSSRIIQSSIDLGGWTMEGPSSEQTIFQRSVKNQAIDYQ
jgi:hypothetical protein